MFGPPATGETDYARTLHLLGPDMLVHRERPQAAGWSAFFGLTSAKAIYPQQRQRIIGSI